MLRKKQLDKTKIIRRQKKQSTHTISQTQKYDNTYDIKDMLK